MALVGNLYRVTWWWAAITQGGSETMLIQRAESNTGTVADGIKSVMLKRAKLLGNRGTLTAYRVSKYTDASANRVNNVSEIRLLNEPGTQTTRNNQGNDIDATGENFAQSLQLTCYEPTEQRRKIIFMGYPWEVNFDGNQRYDPVPQWNAAIGSWITDLVNGGWGWIGKKQQDPINITDYLVNPVTGIATFTVASAPGWTLNNKKIQIHIAFADKSPFDGVQTIVPKTATTFVTTHPIGARPFEQAGPGHINLYTPFFYSLNPSWPSVTPGTVGRIGQVQPVRRARGKPRPATVGRSPNVVKW